MNPVAEVSRIPFVADESWHAERALAGARCVLAVGFLAVLSFGQVAHGGRGIAFSCALFYFVYSLAILGLIHFKGNSNPRLLAVIHGLDVLWALTLAVLTAGANPLIYALFLFVLLAAAYRWGFWPALGTAGIVALLLFLTDAGLRRFGDWHRASIAAGRGGLVAEIACLLTIGPLLGYLMGRERQVRVRTTVVDRLIAKADPEAGIRETIGEVLTSIMALFGSRKISLALRENATGRAFFWEGVTAEDGAPGLHCRGLEAPVRDGYFFSASGESWCALRLRRHRHNRNVRLLVLGARGERLRNVSCAFPRAFFKQNAFRSLLAVAFDLDGDWSGRLFVPDPGPGLDHTSDLRFLQALVQDLAPALHSVYLLWRLRSRIRRAERARIARELHDEVVQSLIAAEMRVELLRRKAGLAFSGMAEELSQIQNLLRREVTCVRGLMQKLKSLELRPEELLASVEEIVERFRCETGISAQFVAGAEKVALPPRVCGEMARIVQEALVNVRKHSGAHHVLVRFAADHGLCQLVVEDDGRGFEFSGRLSQSDLEHLQKGPRVLQERVRSIRGELNIESVPGRGARLEIRVPQKSVWTGAVTSTGS